MEVFQRVKRGLRACYGKYFLHTNERDIWNGVFLLTAIIGLLFSAIDVQIFEMSKGTILVFASLFGFMASKRSVYWFYLLFYIIAFLAVPALSELTSIPTATYWVRKFMPPYCFVRYLGITYPYVAHMTPYISAIFAVILFSLAEITLMCTASNNL